MVGRRWSDFNCGNGSYRFIFPIFQDRHLKKFSTQKSKFDTRIKVAQFLTLIPNLRSKLVNSVGKVKNKGVLTPKTWFLASKWVKSYVLTTFDCRFGFAIKNWTSWQLGLKIFYKNKGELCQNNRGGGINEKGWGVKRREGATKFK